MTPRLIKRCLATVAAASRRPSPFGAARRRRFHPLFNTGTIPRTLLGSGQDVADIHYFYTLSPTAGPPVTVDSTIWPIFGGPWVPNNANSQWIGPDQ